MKIGVIGAGIGGLTAAIALTRHGHSVEVYEQAAEIRPVGAGIIMAHNACQVFRKLGIYDEVRRSGNELDALYVTDERFRPILVNDVARYDEVYNTRVTAVRRSELHRILLAALPEGTVHLGHRCLEVKDSPEGVSVYFENGKSARFDVLLGADGLNSRVRPYVQTAAATRSGKQACWRAVCELEGLEQYRNRLVEAWGRGKRFGFVRVNEREIYWYALQNQPDKPVELTKEQLQTAFAEFDAVAAALIRATPAHRILRNDLADLKPIAQWYKGNVCLIGDAAHATTPNLGQGACQAIEDAYFLATCFRVGTPVSNVFEEFQRKRLHKAHRVMKTSSMIGKMAHLQNPVARMIRNGLLKSMPASMSDRQNRFLYSIDY